MHLQREMHTNQYACIKIPSTNTKLSLCQQTLNFTQVNSLHTLRDKNSGLMKGMAVKWLHKQQENCLLTKNNSYYIIEASSQKVTYFSKVTQHALYTIPTAHQDCQKVRP